jgi:hypothetical protein
MATNRVINVRQIVGSILAAAWGSGGKVQVDCFVPCCEPLPYLCLPALQPLLTFTYSPCYPVQSLSVFG